TRITHQNPIKNIFTPQHLPPPQPSIIPLIFPLCLLSILHKRLHKIIPNSIHIILTPTLTLLLIPFLTIFIIIPLPRFLSHPLLYLINSIIELPPIFSPFIIAPFFLPLLMLGLHH
ncbi:PTS transporter subunit EIIC, partial [Staphylococcus epidermidis]|uniref:PTS transporter subunit EIIC n=1 Tax=Staphylococcus epidermidis TaxID=1282 RepID=UPI0037D9B004